MGNCVETFKPVVSSPSSVLPVDCTPLKESGVPIIFVIGGPNVGKRIITVKVAQKYGLFSIITADIIRNEVSKKTERAFELSRMMSQGRLVPSHILVELITIKMLDNLNANKGFIVSGFPREVNQGRVFGKEVRPPDLVLYLNVRNSVMSDRIMARSVLTTSRLTLNFDYIRSVIEDFHKRNKPVIKIYRKVLVVIDAEYDVDTIVFENACNVVDDLLLKIPAYQNLITTAATDASNTPPVE